MSADHPAPPTPAEVRRRGKARRITLGVRFVRATFSPEVEWLAQVRAVAQRDLAEGGSGIYGVFLGDDGNQYFDRVRPGNGNAWLWTYDAATKKERAAVT